MTTRTSGRASVAAIVAGLLAVNLAAQQSIKIGVIQPLTGSFAASGGYVANGARIAADEINAKGGVLGKKIELVVEDNKSNPTESSSVAEKLIVRDKVPVLMGAWGSSLTLAVMPKLMEYQVPMLVETSSSDKITTIGNPFVFRISPPSSVEAIGFAKVIDQLKIGKADFLVVNNDWGLGTAEQFGKMFRAHNIKVGLVESMSQNAQDMSAQLAKIKASDADTLIVTTAVEQLTLIFKQAFALGLRRRIITTGGSQEPDQLIEQAAAIEKAGRPDAAAIRAALWNVEITGLGGKIKFNKVGPAGMESGQSACEVYLVRIENGRVVVPKA
jgi:branched-chain amino acid transport system substrate-binding protein